MNSKISTLIYFILIMMPTICCRQTNTADSANLPVAMDDSSRVVIDRAIAYAGGYDNWQQKKTLSFDKKSISYDSTGKVIREIDQHFDYMLKSQFRAKVTYTITIQLLHKK
ncbi:MAG: hypothetical protein WKF91_16650 [Segetibacter sp.]